MMLAELEQGWLRYDFQDSKGTSLADQRHPHTLLPLLLLPVPGCVCMS